MRLQDYFRDAFNNLRQSPTRTFLTMLGIIIGVGSVILLSIVGQGAQSVILGAASAVGANQVSIFAGPGDGAGRPDFENPKPLKVGDAEKIKQLPVVSAASVIIISSGQVNFDGNEISASALGVDADYFTMNTLNLASGRLIESGDVTGGARVAVIGSDIATESVFPNGIDPIGQIIKFKKQSFQVIGILKSSTTFRGNKSIYIPSTTARAFLTGTDDITYMIATIDGDLELGMEEIRLAMRDRRGIINPTGDLAQDDFRVSASASAVSLLSTITGALSLFLSAIAGISLIVGGIGIMNIMLVAVSERTREIGLRKALGATTANIVTQFLSEAVLLCVTGGLIGVIGGLGLGKIGALIAVRFVDGWLYVIPWHIVVLAVMISAGVGLVFGVYPALRAGRLNPIESLRYE